MGSVGNATNSSVTQNTTADAASVGSSSPEITPPSPEPLKPQPDPSVAARTQQGLRQNAAEYKNQGDFRSQFMREELSKRMEEGAGKPVLFQDHQTVQAAPAGDPRTLQEKGKAAGDGSGMPAPTNLKEYAYDAVAKKVSDRISGMRSNLTNKVYPKISEEQEALHDVAAGVKKYQEYIAYAQQAAAILKVAPNNTAVKEALAKNLGNLDEISKKLSSAASTLGKVGKYANLVSDAIGIANSAQELVQKIPKDFRDGKAVAEFADALKDTSDNAQAWFDRGKDALLAAGKSGAAVTLSYVTGIVSIGVDGLQAGVKNVNAYIDRTKDTIRRYEKGGMKPKDLEPPPPPPPHKTYKELQLQEHNEKVSQVSGAIDNQFADARDGVKRAFQARHQEVHNKFDKEVLPKLYLQHRREFMKKIQAEVNDPDQYETLLNKKMGPGYLEESRKLLSNMKEHAPRTAQEAEDEMRALQRHYGDYDKKGILIPKSVEEIFPLYRPELDKFYEKNGFGEGALEKEYIQYGLTNDAKRKLQREVLHNLGLDQLPF
jgi:hypothetical protein